MSRVDLHPEDLLDLQRQGRLDLKQEEQLRAHLTHCDACAAESLLIEDFRTDLAEAPEDAAVLQRAIAQTIGAPASARPRRGLRRPLMIAAAVLLLSGTTAAALSLGPTVWRRVIAPIIAWDAPAEPDKEIERRAPRRAPSPAPAPEPEPVVEEVVPSIPEEAPPRPAVRKQRRARRPARRAPTSRASKGAETPVPESAATLFGAANRARAAGRYSDAIRLYRRLTREHRGAREEVASRVSMGRVWLDQLADPGRALRLFDSYLAAAPSGTLAEEARIGRAVALGQLGRLTEEATAWRIVLELHPKSAHAARARKRLKALRRQAEPE